jgi:hypothetical protein
MLTNKINYLLHKKMLINIINLMRSAMDGVFPCSFGGFSIFRGFLIIFTFLW